MKEVELVGLKVRLVGGTDREGGGEGPLVVLMHGFGAPGADLVPLYRQLDVPHEVRFAFPEAPMRLEDTLGAMYAGARAWWMIDVAALAGAMSGQPRADRSAEVPEGLDEARSQLQSGIEALTKTLRVPEGNLVLGGFSQGAMLALDVALHSDVKLAGLVLMSGTLIASGVWQPLLSKHAGLRVLQSHGRADALLPFAMAQRLHDMLRDAGLDVRWIEFNGGHTITNGVVSALAAFIREVLPA